MHVEKEKGRLGCRFCLESSARENPHEWMRRTLGKGKEEERVYFKTAKVGVLLMPKGGRVEEEQEGEGTLS